MAESPPPRKRYSRSPSPRRARSKSRSPSKSRGRPESRSRQRNISRSRSRSRSRGRTTEVVNPGNTLYVTGLSTRVTDRDLEEHFSKEGKVASAFLVMEPRTRISRGFGFVTMETVEDANHCIKHLNQSVLEGRYITVEKSRRKRPRTPTPGHYLGLGDRREGRGGGGDRYRSRRDDYGPRRSPRRSPPYRGGGRERSPPYRGGGRQRSPPYHGGERERSPLYRGGGREGSPPYRGGRDRSPPRYSGREREYSPLPPPPARRSPPYSAKPRRERSRSPPPARYSPYGSPDRGYSRGAR